MKAAKKSNYKYIILCGCLMRVNASDQKELSKLLHQDKERIRKNWEKNQLD